MRCPFFSIGMIWDVHTLMPKGLRCAICCTAETWGGLRRKQNQEEFRYVVWDRANPSNTKEMTRRQKIPRERGTLQTQAQSKLTEQNEEKRTGTSLCKIQTLLHCSFTTTKTLFVVYQSNSYIEKSSKSWFYQPNSWTMCKTKHFCLL